MHKLVLLLLTAFCLQNGASAQSDWESYVMQVNQKPVSVVVDLALKTNGDTRKTRPFVVIFRTKLLSPDASGQPGPEERPRLDAMENQLEAGLQKSNGAVYAGRFTQRGLRELYFYTLDTIQFRTTVAQILLNYPGYQWLCQARMDAAWSHYQEVLYPSERDLEIILNRRQLEELAEKGDPLTAIRRIDHYIYFKSRTGRDEFIRSLGGEGFQIESMNDVGKDDIRPFALQIYRDDRPGYPFIQTLLIPLWERARKFQGQYDGWKTEVVREKGN
jgi:hypothetical protein